MKGEQPYRNREPVQVSLPSAFQQHNLQLCVHHFQPVPHSNHLFCCECHRPLQAGMSPTERVYRSGPATGHHKGIHIMWIYHSIWKIRLLQMGLEYCGWVWQSVLDSQMKCCIAVSYLQWIRVRGYSNLSFQFFTVLSFLAEMESL